jgi:hypothetical protein
MHSQLEHSPGRRALSAYAKAVLRGLQVDIAGVPAWRHDDIADFIGAALAADELDVAAVQTLSNRRIIARAVPLLMMAVTVRGRRARPAALSYWALLQRGSTS